MKKVCLDQSKAWIAVAVITLLILGIFAYIAFSGGVRGTDQFWYLQDTESAMKGVFTTSIYYPCLLKRGVSGLTPQPFIHNVSSVYVAAFIGLFTSPYLGWVIQNTVSILLSAILLYFIFKKIVRPWLSISLSVLYAVLPLTFWSMIQVLSEASTSLLLVVFLYLYFNFKDSLIKWYLMSAVSIILAANVRTFLPLLALVPIAMLVFRNEHLQRRRVLIHAAILLILSLSGYRIFSKLFPFYRSGGSILYNISMVALPGGTGNMGSFFSVNKTLPDAATFCTNVIRKALYNLYVQFVPRSLQKMAFNLPFNIFALFSIIGTFRAKEKEKKYFYSALLFFALLLITVCLFQNQSRYEMMVMPALFIGFGISINNLIEKNSLRKIVSILLILAILSSLAVDFVLADRSKNEGIAAKTMVTQLRDACEEYIPEDATLLDIGELTMLAAYAVNRPLLRGSKTASNYLPFFDYVTPDYILASGKTERTSVLDEYETIHTFNVGTAEYEILKHR